MITINTSKIERVTLIPMEESSFWKIFPAKTITKGFWPFKETINLDISVQGIGSRYTYTIDEFILNENNCTIKDGLVYNNPRVIISLVSGLYSEKYFDNDSDAVKFYDSIVNKIGYKISYA